VIDGEAILDELLPDATGAVALLAETRRRIDGLGDDELRELAAAAARLGAINDGASEIWSICLGVTHRRFMAVKTQDLKTQETRPEA
jgi:hypothetical protein